ncbi:MAG: 3-hydroxyacyl-CoA dehydrogenase NAD-binding domain-containing protein [Gaiellaceae bacterium]
MNTDFKLNRVETKLGPLALVTMDNGADHTKPTVLGRSAFESAVGVVEQLERGGWVAMVLTGKPYIFAAGADIEEFPKLRTHEQAVAGSRIGHELFGRIRALPYPTVAAINGVCLGGGLEIALHCSARTLSTAVRHFGCPEVFLGILPGWGGTQLIPRLVGADSAIRVIVTNPLRQNKLLDARKAFELGFADRLLEPVEFLDESIAFALELVESPLERRETDHGDAETTFRRARSQVDDAVHGATRAPYLALDLIELACNGTPLEEGLRAEAETIADLMLSPQARRSLYAFDVVERRVKKGVGIPDVPPRKLEKIGIVGAGLMATQLATLFLKRLGVPLVIRDLDQGTVDRAVAAIREELGDRWCPVIGTTGVEDFAGCDLVVEAVFEEMSIKQQVLAEVREVAGPACILATNTSSLSVAEMGADVGLHFFNPVAVMPLVELVRTDATTDETLATAWDLTKRLRKRAVVVGDAPGFVVNRVLTRMTSMLMDALEHGNTVEETDEAILKLGLPMAPSVLLAMVGPRVANHVLVTLHDAYPERFPLSPTLANYADGKDDIVVTEHRPRTVDEITRDVLDAMADEIRHLLDEGVVAEPADVDACLILGAGWPFFLGGITPYLRDEGIALTATAAG